MQLEVLVGLVWFYLITQFYFFKPFLFCFACLLLSDLSNFCLPKPFCHALTVGCSSAVPHCHTKVTPCHKIGLQHRTSLLV